MIDLTDLPEEMLEERMNLLYRRLSVLSPSSPHHAHLRRILDELEVKKRMFEQLGSPDAFGVTVDQPERGVVIDTDRPPEEENVSGPRRRFGRRLRSRRRGRRRRPSIDVEPEES